MPSDEVPFAMLNLKGFRTLTVTLYEIRGPESTDIVYVNTGYKFLSKKLSRYYGPATLSGTRQVQELTFKPRAFYEAENGVKKSYQELGSQMLGKFDSTLPPPHIAYIAGSILISRLTYCRVSFDSRKCGNYQTHVLPF